MADLRDVAGFWLGEDDVASGTKKELVERLDGLLHDEGIVYRRVRTLTRKVLDVLVLLLGREGYASDLPGLFQRLPGQEPVALEFHEAEAGLKALARRGFVGVVSTRTSPRVLYAVPHELGSMLTGLFREETRTVGSVFGLARHLAALSATERQALRSSFPALPARPGTGDVEAVLGDGGALSRLAALGPGLEAVVRYAIEHHEGVMRRGRWSRRDILADLRWDRRAWEPLLEAAGVGTIARLGLGPYGIACDDEVLVVFREVLEDFHQRQPDPVPDADLVLRGGCDLVADLGFYLESIRRHPVRVSREGEVYKAALKRIQAGFVFRESSLAGPAEIFAEVASQAEHLGLVTTDDEGFLSLRPEADIFLAKPLDEKVRAMTRLALEQAGPQGRSLHQRELRGLVDERLKAEPMRWWSDRSLASSCRHRYLESLDDRGIAARHRDRFFSAYFSGRETPGDLLDELQRHWLPRLYRLGLLDVAMRDDRPVAWRLSTLGARVLGVELHALDTGLEPLLVNPDFEVLVLPEGDVSDVVHTLDGFAQRTKTEDVVHFRLTREAFEAAVAAGRDAAGFLAFLDARARGGLPQNVRYSLEAWAGSVTFAMLERGVLLTAPSEEALDRILAVPGMEPLLLRRLGTTEALLREAPTDRKLLTALRERHVELRGP
ncbi:MAG: helicase-associated domain-containing protein [Planctomycetes bacterium]|nr:helicase-associated domain-containing protein [Planctomycetota bacterium]